MAQLAVLLLALFGVHQILCQGPRTGWPVQNTGIGMNAGVPALDPTDYQIDMAVMGINTATTEAAAAQAAAAVYNPAFDMADAVKNALETRVRVLRTPPGWPHPIPPPLPFGFDVMNLITTAYYNNMNGAALQPYPAQPANAALPSYGQQPGLNQAQRTAATGMQGNALNNRLRQDAWQAGNTAAQRFPGNWGNQALARNQQQTGPTNFDWTPLASSMSGWVDPFYNAESISSWFK